MLPYDSPGASVDADPELDAEVKMPGRMAIWSVAGLSFCAGLASAFGAWAFWRTPELLAGLSGFAYFYYALRLVVISVGFLGLSWKCFRYVDAIEHNPMNSLEVRRAHGGVWNWMAMMLAGFLTVVVFHSLAGQP